MYREYTTYSQYTGGLKWKLPKMMTSFMNSPLLWHYLNWSFSILIIAHLYHNSCPSECSWPEWRRKGNEMKCKIKKRKIGSNTKYTKKYFFLQGRVFDVDQGTWAPLAATSLLKWQREWNLFVKEDQHCFGFVNFSQSPIAKHPGVMQPLLRSRNLSLRHVKISSNQTDIFSQILRIQNFPMGSHWDGIL